MALFRILIFASILSLIIYSCHGKIENIENAIENDNNSNDAYVSILSSENFVIAAKIIAFQLHSFSPKIPFILFCTEDISNKTFHDLEVYGAKTKRISKIDTPFLENHPQKKFQYTKTALWCHTEFTRIVYLDLDILVLSDISELFECGEFCASLRHSDMFNSGIFTFRPNNKTCQDMAEQKTKLQSYDGGDQGFLNSYYNDIKFSPMFNPSNLSAKEHYRSLRLSAIYNYDIGMYYLSGRMLVEPKIIHYTLVFLKPWIWWTYPIFDLNWKWLEIRGKMEKIHGREDDIISNILVETIVIVGLFGAYLITCLRAPQKAADCSTNVSNFEKRFVGFILLGCSFLISFALTPEQMWPTHAWALFTFNLATFLSFFLALYSKHRLSADLSFSSSLQAALAVVGPILLCWNCLYFIDNLGKRYLCGILFIAAFILGINEIIKLILFSKNCRQFRYLSLRKQ